MSSFGLGDRVEIFGEIAGHFESKIGVIIAADESVVYRRKFTVRLADGTESVFLDSQLQVTPPVFADLIFDTQVSPIPQGLRGLARATSHRHMRFISREFDIHIRLAERKTLLGQISANAVAPEPSLITLLTDGKPLTSTTTDAFGEFNLQGVPAGNVMLEILSPWRRILAQFDSRQEGLMFC
jgi:hypothetical protein